jgi:hypothetical protein
MTFPKVWNPEHNATVQVAEAKLRGAEMTMSGLSHYRVSGTVAPGATFDGKKGYPVKEINVTGGGDEPVVEYYGSPGFGGRVYDGSSTGAAITDALGKLALDERGRLSRYITRIVFIGSDLSLMYELYRANDTGGNHFTTEDIPKGKLGSDDMNWGEDETEKEVTARYLSYATDLITLFGDKYWGIGSINAEGLGANKTWITSQGLFGDSMYAGDTGFDTATTISLDLGLPVASVCAFTVNRSANVSDYGFDDLRPKYKLFLNPNVVGEAAVHSDWLPVDNGNGRNFSAGSSFALPSGAAIGFFAELVQMSESAHNNGHLWLYRITPNGIAAPNIERVEVPLPADYKGLVFDNPPFDNPYISPILFGDLSRTTEDRLPATPERSWLGNGEWIVSAKPRNSALALAASTVRGAALDNDRAIFATTLCAVWNAWTNDPRNRDYYINPLLYPLYGNDALELTPALREIEDQACRAVFYRYDSGSVQQIEFPLWTYNVAPGHMSGLKLADGVFLLTMAQARLYIDESTPNPAKLLLYTEDNGSTWQPFTLAGLPHTQLKVGSDGAPTVLKTTTDEDTGRPRAKQLGFTAREGDETRLYVCTLPWDNGVVDLQNVEWKRRQVLYKGEKQVFTRGDYGYVSRVSSIGAGPMGAGGIGARFERLIDSRGRKYPRNVLQPLTDYFSP